jgi:hypothetical protein
MAVFGFSWGISYAIGPMLAGMVLDSDQPNVLWYAAGVVGLLATAGFLHLSRQRGFARRAAVAADTPS